jgi:hypothetical protein
MSHFVAAMIQFMAAMIQFVVAVIQFVVAVVQFVAAMIQFVAAMVEDKWGQQIIPVWRLTPVIGGWRKPRPLNPLCGAGLETGGRVSKATVNDFVLEIAPPSLLFGLT